MTTSPSQQPQPMTISPLHNLPPSQLPSSSSSSLEAPKQFQLADLARAAMANPRQYGPWSPSSPSTSTSSAADWLSSSSPDSSAMDVDDDDEDEDTESLAGSSSPFSTASRSAFSTPASSVPPSPFSTASSCALSPSNSSEGFTLGESEIPFATPDFESPRPAPPAPVSSIAQPPRTPPPRLIRRAPLRSNIPLSSPSSSITLPSPPPAAAPSSPVARPALAPAPPAHAEGWSRDGFSLRLFFTSPNSTTPSEGEDDEHSLPPAFFPSARINFSPRLRVTALDGVAYSALGGMHLGVTGICETLNPDGSVKTKRLIADFCTDLSAGLAIWKRDGEAAQTPGIAEGRLAPGSYVLPLSMHIPNSDKLPPSFECSQFRIHYTMSIALFSSTLSSAGTPLHLKVFSIPFHLLPSTLPTPAPELPILTHDHKKSVLASIFKSLSSQKPETGYHHVYPSLPTSHFSPASHATIPVGLRIVDRPLEPTDLYIRLALIRKTYVRESTSSSLASAVEDEWGLGFGVTPAQMGYAEETIIEPYCREEEEITSRWGWIPYSARPGADPTARSEVVIEDIALPLSGLVDELTGEQQGWQHGYSTSIDMEPTLMPSLAHGDCSWFSPAFRHGPPTAKEYARHVHVSSRFYLAVEVGFATPQLKETLQQISSLSPDMEMPSANSFTTPKPPQLSRYSGASTTNPFAPTPSRFRSTSNSASSPSPAFPGKLRELLIPITIGSVAEPSMECIATANESSSQRAEREAREERGEDTRREGEGPEGAWMCAPPLYEEALKSSPAYVC